MTIFADSTLYTADTTAVTADAGVDTPPAGEITVDDSVARWTGTPAGNVDITSASFTAPANSLLVLTIGSDQQAGNTAEMVFAVATTGLTWTRQIKRDHSDEDAKAASSIWTAEDVSGGTRTVAVRRTSANGGTNRFSCKVYVCTGQSATPIGVTASGGHTASGNASATATGAGRFFAVTTDWSAAATITSDASATIEDDFYTGACTVATAFKNADHVAGAVAIPFTYSATPAANWCAIEILAAEGAPPGDAGYIKVWNGSAWVSKPMKVWNGSSWQIKPLKRWTGAAWV